MEGVYYKDEDRPNRVYMSRFWEMRLERSQAGGPGDATLRGGARTWGDRVGLGQRRRENESGCPLALPVWVWFDFVAGAGRGWGFLGRWVRARAGFEGFPCPVVPVTFPWFPWIFAAIR